MKRSTFDGQVLVYRYGCPSWAELDEEGMRQLRLAHDLRNELVAIEKRWEAMASAVWLSFPEVAAAQAVVAEATACVEELEREMAAVRIRSQSTIPDPRLRRELVEARRARSSAKADLKATKERLKPAMKERRAELDAAKRCAMGGCKSPGRCKGGDDCKPACHHRCPEPDAPRFYDVWAERGLGWASYTDVLDKHRLSVARVIGARQQGEKAEHRFRAWTGEGTITVQVQRAADGCLRRQWELVDGRHAKEWLARDRRVHELRTDKRRTLRVQIGRSRAWGPHWLELPVVVHRPLPAGGEVTYVRVTRRRVAGQARLAVTLTLRLPRVERKVVGEVVDVDFGWASGGKGAGVRVAQVSSASGILPEVPSELASVVTVGDWCEVWAPAAWRDLLGRDDAIRADRSELLDDLRPAVVEALSRDPELAQRVGFTAAQARVMKFGKYARLARLLPPDHPLAATLEAWRSRDRHLWEFESHERQQTIARRRDAYRKVAAWIAGAARVIAIKEVDVAELRRKPGTDSEDPYGARGSRRNIQFAAPAELRAAIETAALRRGVKVIYYGAEVES